VYELHRAPPLVPAAVSAVFRAASEFAPQAPSAQAPPAAEHVVSQVSLVVVCSTQDPGVTVGSATVGGGVGVTAGGGGVTVGGVTVGGGGVGVGGGV